MSDETLVAVGIKRGDAIHDGGKGGHRGLRQMMDPDNMHGDAVAGDIDGFITSTGRFVDREEAKAIAVEAGQCRPMARDLLSSDVDW